MFDSMCGSDELTHICGAGSSHGLRSLQWFATGNANLPVRPPQPVTNVYLQRDWYRVGAALKKLSVALPEISTWFKKEAICC